MKNQEHNTCALCKTVSTDLIQEDMINPSFVNVIRQEHPEVKPDFSICPACLQKNRSAYVENILEEERGELTALEEEVARSMAEQEILAKNTNTELDIIATFGDKISDKVAAFGGSWKFIIIFMSILVLWIFTNAIIFSNHSFDPYPFILLNLILSCIAALQAPVIMMSQNRQDAKDRIRADHDYKVNLKAELEVRHLKEKVDYLLTKQWQRLIDIQKIQIDLMNELIEKKKNNF
jgi:uncharacterized membrane protein